MSLAIFGIENTALNLVVTFAIVCVAAIWIALIVFTFTDARRRISDPFLVGCATAASLFPFVGTIVYSILRPPEFLEDVRERETEVKTSEVEMRHLEAHSCHKCGYPTETDFVRCPSCRTRLKEPCPTCDRPTGIDWKVCPYCETTLIAPPKRSSRSGSSKSGKPAKESRRERSDRSERTERSEKSREGEPRRSGRRAAKQAKAESGTGSGSGSSRSGSRSGSSSSSSSSSRSSKPSGSSSSSSGSRPAGREASRSDGERSESGRRASRSSRSKTAVINEGSEKPSKPINSGE